MKIKKTLSEIETEVNQINNSGIDDFESLSPFQMHNIIYKPFEIGCVVQLNQMNCDDYNRVPILSLMKRLVEEVDPDKGLKLTSVGNIPPKIVKRIYDEAEFPDDAIESGIVRINKEDDCEAVVTARELLILCGMLKVRNNIISRTKKCDKLLMDSCELLKILWRTFPNKFNVCYFDGYPENECGTFAFAYVLYLLSKYGKQNYSLEHYGKLYLKAFPFLAEKFDGRYRSQESEVLSCMTVRMFHRFLNYFGIIKIEGKYEMHKTTIRVTELFSMMIKITGT